jgi:hypothetical protein
MFVSNFSQCGKISEQTLSTFSCPCYSVTIVYNYGHMGLGIAQDLKLSRCVSTEQHQSWSKMIACMEKKP